MPPPRVRHAAAARSPRRRRAFAAPPPRVRLCVHARLTFQMTVTDLQQHDFHQQTQVLLIPINSY
jgi:hypothetical protein